MLLVLVAHLVFPEAARAGAKPRPEFSVRKIVSAKVETSWRNLTSTAEVQLPGRWLFQKQQIKINEWLKRGDRIEISLGYNGKLVKEFTGYVTDISPRIPITISCEDEMYRLKRTPVKCSYASVRLPKLLKDICPAGTKIDALDVDLGQFRAKNCTVAKVLEKVKELYGMVSYFQDGTLHCGRVYMRGSTGKPTEFSFQRDVLTDQLDYRERDDLKVIVKATSHQLKGKNITVTVGDVDALDAEERTLNYFQVGSAEALRAVAQHDIDKLKVEGYKGSFSTYGAPSVQHGQLAGLTSSDYPERDGVFFIDSVAKSFDSGGYRQEITLGSRAALRGL